MPCQRADRARTIALSAVIRQTHKRRAVADRRDALTIKMGLERARVVSWDEGNESALITTMPAMTLLSERFLARCVDAASTRGFKELRTSALSPLEQATFLRAGFEVRSELCLLAMSLHAASTALRVDGPGGVWHFKEHEDSRLEEMIDIDRAAFGVDSGFGLPTLRESIAATPTTSVRVGVSAQGATEAYAVFGRSTLHGYVQRLAVRPSAQRRGAGRGLLCDGLDWMRRGRAGRAFVNTERGNEAALALYRSVGFEEQGSSLSTLSLSLR